jgi:uncharacterized protein (DUF3820 family)
MVIVFFSDDRQPCFNYCGYIYNVENIKPDSNVLVEIVQTKMPFGKYKGTLVSDIPVSYLEWMHSKGFPPGKLGMMLATVYEIKTNGLTEILFKVKRVVAKKIERL